MPGVSANLQDGEDIVDVVGSAAQELVHHFEEHVLCEVLDEDVLGLAINLESVNPLKATLYSVPIICDLLYLSHFLGLCAFYNSWCFLGIARKF